MMNLFLGFFERTLTSMVISLALAFASFSYFTGNFPPRKQDLFKAIRLSRQMISETANFKQAGKDFQEAQSQGGPPNMEQMADYQRIALRRTEVTMELLKIFKRFRLGYPNPETGAKLERITIHLNEAEKEMVELAAEIQKGTEAPPANQ